MEKDISSIPTKGSKMAVNIVNSDNTSDNEIITLVDVHKVWINQTTDTVSTNSQNENPKTEMNTINNANISRRKRTLSVSSTEAEATETSVKKQRGPNGTNRRVTKTKSTKQLPAKAAITKN